MKNPYVGRQEQLYGVDEVRLIGGKGDGMRLLQIRNGSGLELTVSADRCADIARAQLNGVNLGYFSPVGFVGPAYYDDRGANFLRSFTAGFLTTCGLNAAGNPCSENGEDFPLHGRIANTPAEHIYYTVDDKEIRIHATMRQAQVFGTKMKLERTIICPIGENRMIIEDTVENEGAAEEPVMLLYHMNMGYPLLDENAQLNIPSKAVAPRNDHAAEDIDHWQEVLAPQAGYVEECFYHTFEGDTGCAELKNPKSHVGVRITFPTECLNYFTQWKQMGETEYVLGLEPGNCVPDGRVSMREKGTLQFLKPGEQKHFTLTVDFLTV